jgi:hypothetical protein
MSNPIIQLIAEGLGLTEPVNGSWIQAIASYYGITTPTNGSWEQAIAEELGATESVNGSWIQTIADAVGVTQTVNGTWVFAIEQNGLGPNFPVPTNLLNSAQGYTTLDYTWTAGGTETSWEVEFGEAGVGGTFATAVTESYQMTSLTPDTLYELRVRAIISAGTFSNYTAPVVASTDTIGVPANLTGTNITSSSFVAGWDAVTDANYYDVEISGVGTFSSLTTSYTATTLTAETTYDFRARAVIEGFAGDWSAYESVTTLTASTFSNDYSMNFIRTTTAANIELLKIDNKSNSIDTAIRDSTPNITVTGWFKLDSTANATNRTLFSKYNPSNVGGNYRDVALLITINASNRLEIYATANNLTTTTVSCSTTQTFTSTDEWVHFAFVYDSSQTTANTIKKIYINGVEVTSFAANTVSTTDKFFQNQTTEADRANIRIGSALSASQTEDFGFGGELDEFTFWDKSLSSAEITQLYNSGKAYDISLMSSYSTNCLAWWRMGDFSGDNWDGSKWNIINAKGTASTDLVSVNLVEADRVTDAPPII